MALNYSISFNLDSTIKFVDNSDYSGLTVTATKLEITYPKISDNTLIEIDLFNVNIASLGDDLDILISAFNDLTTLIDGTYKFRLVAYNGGAEVASLILYVNQWYNIKGKRRLLVESIVDKECSSKYCILGEINALITAADEYAASDTYLKAQEIVSFLKAETQKDTFI